jgi:hypothetical protein
MAEYFACKYLFRNTLQGMQLVCDSQALRPEYFTAWREKKLRGATSRGKKLLAVVRI